MCCRLLEIRPEHAPEVAHPAGEWCRHCVKPGCGIYDRRPSLCQTFACQWLLDQKLGAEWYPPTAGMILAFDGAKAMYVVVDPDRSDAHREEPRASQIARMASWGRRAPVPFEVKITGPVERKI
jgi:hypothetical protein